MNAPKLCQYLNILPLFQDNSITISPSAFSLPNNPINPSQTLHYPKYHTDLVHLDNVMRDYCATINRLVSPQTAQVPTTNNPITTSIIPDLLSVIRDYCVNTPERVRHSDENLYLVYILFVIVMNILEIHLSNPPLSHIPDVPISSISNAIFLIQHSFTHCFNLGQIFSQLPPLSSSFTPLYQQHDNDVPDQDLDLFGPGDGNVIRENDNANDDIDELAQLYTNDPQHRHTQIPLLFQTHCRDICIITLKHLKICYNLLHPKNARDIPKFDNAVLNRMRSSVVYKMYEFFTTNTLQLFQHTFPSTDPSRPFAVSNKYAFYHILSSPALMMDPSLAETVNSIEDLCDNNIILSFLRHISDNNNHLAFYHPFSGAYSQYITRTGDKNQYDEEYDENMSIIAQDNNETCTDHLIHLLRTLLQSFAAHIRTDEYYQFNDVVIDALLPYFYLISQSTVLVMNYILTTIDTHLNARDIKLPTCSQTSWLKFFFDNVQHYFTVITLSELLLYSQYFTMYYLPIKYHSVSDAETSKPHQTHQYPTKIDRFSQLRTLRLSLPTISSQSTNLLNSIAYPLHYHTFHYNYFKLVEHFINALRKFSIIPMMLRYQIFITSEIFTAIPSPSQTFSEEAIDEHNFRVMTISEIAHSFGWTSYNIDINPYIKFLTWCPSVILQNVRQLAERGSNYDAYLHNVGSSFSLPRPSWTLVAMQRVISQQRDLFSEFIITAPDRLKQLQNLQQNKAEFKNLLDIPTLQDSLVYGYLRNLAFLTLYPKPTLYLKNVNSKQFPIILPNKVSTTLNQHSLDLYSGFNHHILAHLNRKDLIPSITQVSTMLYLYCHRLHQFFTHPNTYYDVRSKSLVNNSEVPFDLLAQDPQKNQYFNSTLLTRYYDGIYDISLGLDGIKRQNGDSTFLLPPSPRLRHHREGENVPENPEQWPLHMYQQQPLTHAKQLTYLSNASQYTTFLRQELMPFRDHLRFCFTPLLSNDKKPVDQSNRYYISHMVLFIPYILAHHNFSFTVFHLLSSFTTDLTRGASGVFSIDINHLSFFIDLLEIMEFFISNYKLNKMTKSMYKKQLHGFIDIPLDVVKANNQFDPYHFIMDNIPDNNVYNCLSSPACPFIPQKHCKNAQPTEQRFELKAINQFDGSDYLEVQTGTTPYVDTQLVEGYWNEDDTDNDLFCTGRDTSQDIGTLYPQTLRAGMFTMYIELIIRTMHGVVYHGFAAPKFNNHSLYPQRDENAEKPRVKTNYINQISSNFFLHHNNIGDGVFSKVFNFIAQNKLLINAQLDQDGNEEYLDSHGNVEDNDVDSINYDAYSHRSTRTVFPEHLLYHYHCDALQKFQEESEAHNPIPLTRDIHCVMLQYCIELFIDQLILSEQVSEDEHSYRDLLNKIDFGAQNHDTMAHNLSQLPNVLSEHDTSTFTTQSRTNLYHNDILIHGALRLNIFNQLSLDDKKALLHATDLNNFINTPAFIPDYPPALVQNDHSFHIVKTNFHHLITVGDNTIEGSDVDYCDLKQDEYLYPTPFLIKE